MSTLALPMISEESGFMNYLQEIRKFPSLEAGEEYMLAKSFVEHKDLASAHKLVTSHLKLVAKIALSFKGYGLPMIELVSEGNIGLMQAVKKFDPDLGFRLSTYAMWWIKASIQEFVLRSWSLVKIGTTAAQKKLFFNLNKMRKKLQTVEARNLEPQDVKSIAAELNVSERDVIDMNNRMMSGSDSSLNEYVSDDSESELIDLLPETAKNQEILYSEQEELGQKQALFNDAMNSLNERERDILKQRRLQEEPATLEFLSNLYNISRERVRQIEAKSFEKLQQYVQKHLSLKVS